MTAYILILCILTPSGAIDFREGRALEVQRFQSKAVCQAEAQRRAREYRQMRPFCVPAPTKRV